MFGRFFPPVSFWLSICLDCESCEFTSCDDAGLCLDVCVVRMYFFMCTTAMNGVFECQ